MTGARHLVDATDNKKIVRTFIDNVFGGNNLDIAIDLLAEDCSWWMIGSLPTAGMYEGKQAIVDSVLTADGGQIVPNTKFIDLKTLIGEGEYVAAEWTGGFKTITNFEYKNHYNVMFEVHDGQIRAIREYNDTLYMKESFFS